MGKKTRHVLFVDLEATSPEPDADPMTMQSEIIEIGVTRLEVPTRTLIDKRSIYVKPKVTALTPFITELTGITQAVLDAQGVSLYEAFRFLRHEYGSEHLIWAGWGDYDRKMVAREAARWHYGYPFSNQYLNVKALYAATRRGYGASLGEALKKLGMEMEGRWHSGADDSWNTARIFLEITKPSIEP